MRKYLLNAEKPIDLLAGVSDPQTGFEKIWAQLPSFDRGSAWTFPVANSGLFLKGQIEPLSLYPKRLWRRGRILREHRGLMWMRSHGLPVPEVLASGAEYQWGLPVRTFLLLERPVGALDMQKKLQDENLDKESRANLFRLLGCNVARLHGAKLAHRDLYLRNILTMVRSGQQQLMFIDCPRVEHRRFWPRANYLQRSDIYSLVRDALKLEVSLQDIEVFLHSAGVEHLNAVIKHARRANRLGRVRPLRSNMWLMFGI